MRITSLRMLIAVLSLALPSQWASAQIATGNANAANAAAANGGTLVPGIGTLPGQTQLTPQQLMGIAQLRALQSRGRGRGVRTGYPQYIPMGPQNMMGRMKFGFINDYGIFLHDTPHKELFNKAKRNLSLGCVRLEHPERLAAWLLGKEPTPPADDSELNVQIDKGVPVYISYLTARPDGSTIAFADDVYKLDGAGEKPTAAASASAAK